MDYMINAITSTLVKEYSVETIAYKIGVSVNTIYRWMRNETTPQPKQEALLRNLYADFQKNHNEINNAVDRCLNELRESFHKTSRFSSRNEALEEISKLFFSHIMSLLTDGIGITKEITKNQKSAAKKLKQFVREQFKLFFSEKHNVDFSFELNIKDSENQFAIEIANIFDNNFQKIKILDSIIGTDILNEIFGKFLTDSFVDQKELGQYLTPKEIINFAIELIFCDLKKEEILEHKVVLDPSCGVGSFLTAYVEKVYSLFENDNRRNDIIKGILENKLVGIDKSERMLRLALTNLAMFGYKNTRLYLKNALDASDLELEGNVSVIMTNPPFGAEFLAEEVSKFDIVSKWAEKKPKKVNSELLFIEQYIKWLKPGGILICIVPDSILNNRGLHETLRNGISKDVVIKAVVSLPSNTFATTGTETKTSLLYLKKEKYTPSHKTYMAICENVGYDVISVGAHKTKRYNGAAELFEILNDYRDKTEKKGQWIENLNQYQRWDATYHASISKEMLQKMKNKKLLQIKDVAELINDRFNPTRLGERETFNYIEISDVNPNQLRTSGKKMLAKDAPSRARKIVHRDDVIVSTVRPERGIVAVVDEKQDGFVCTTGFAVLKPKGIDSLVLALLLQSQFVAKQIKKYVMGVSYPVIDEKDLLEIYLPISQLNNKKYDKDVERIRSLERELNSLRSNLKKAISSEMLTIE